MKRNHTPPITSPLIAMMAGLVITAGTAAAQTTVVLSEDFEAPDVTAAQSTGNTSGAVPSGWIGANQGFGASRRGIVDEAAGAFTDPVGEQAFAFRYTNSGLTSDVGEIGPLSAGTTITVTFDVVLDGHNNTTPYRAAIVTFPDGAARNDCRGTWTAGGTGASAALAITSGNASGTTYETVTFSHTVEATAATLGQDVAVRFFGATSSAIIDNVKVEIDTSNVAYWDLNGVDPGAGGFGSPSGNWDGSNWNSIIDGTGATAGWTPGIISVFSAGMDATGSYDVTLDGAEDITGLFVEEGNVGLLNGIAGSLNLTSSGYVLTSPGSSATIGVPLTDVDDTQVLEKVGSGLLVLSADNSMANGGLILSNGVTRFESASAINGTARNLTINSAGVMAFGASFGEAAIPTALAQRVVATSTGTIAADRFATTDFDFNTPGLDSAYLGAVDSVSYSGTLTPHDTTYRIGGGGGTLTLANINALTGVGNSAVVRGDVTLAAANDLDGGTTLLSGLLTLGNDGSLGSGDLTIAGPGTLAASGTVVTTNPVAANSNFTLGGSGALTLGGEMTLSANRAITNNNTDATTTLGNITGSNRSLTLNGNGNTTVTGNITTGNQGVTKNGAGTLLLAGDNTYSGTTNASGGILVLAGSNSSSGVTVVNAATLQLGSVANGGLASGQITMNNNSAVLQAINADREITNNVLYNASATISGSQSLTINGDFNNNNNRTLTSDISGPGKVLTLTNVNLSSNADNRTLTFTGTGTTVISGAVANGGTSTASAITKTGNGTLALDGVNTYTGNTNVNGGTLLVNGDSSAATGNVTVNNAILGGTGTVGGAVSISSTSQLQPGDNGPGTLTINAATAISGAVFIDLNGVAADRIDVGGDLDLSDVDNNSINFFEAGAGATQASYTLATFTGILTGEFGFVSGLPAGYSIVYPGDPGGSAGQILLTSDDPPVGTPFENWAATYPGLTDTSPTLDFDGGGLATALEWVLGGDPTDPSDDAGLLPAIDATSDPDGKLLFTFRRTIAAEADVNTTIAVEYGSDLSGWTVAAHEGTGPEQITISVVADGFGGGIDAVTVALPANLAGVGKLFARLSAEVAP